MRKSYSEGPIQLWFFSSTLSILPNQQFYAANKYIHVTEEGEEDSLFFLAEAIVPTDSTGGIGPLAVDVKNRADGAEAKDAPILLSSRTSNICLKDMVELRHQGISIDGDNNPAPENVPRQGETTTGTGNWRRDGIIFPRKDGNLQNSFASFGHYSHDAILCMSLIQLFLIFFPRGLS